MPEDLHWQKYVARFKTYDLNIPLPAIPVDLVVCIPVYAEPDVITTMESLLRCTVPACQVEVLLLFNQSNRMTPQEQVVHQKSWDEVNAWIDALQPGPLRFVAVYMDQMPDPKGGVGWARKLVMDEAARRLPPDGILLCLDADCRVSENYLSAVCAHFVHDPECDAASIYFEHPLDNLMPDTRRAIIQYELHLRYLVRAIRWAGHPFSYHTVGSSMAVRRRTYLAQGGMNTRQAGEDFYFLQKCIELGHFSEITSATVFPSARKSTRVPFGTGRAMTKMESEGNEWCSADFEVFKLIRPLLTDIDRLYEIKLRSIYDGQLFAALSDLDQRLIHFLQEIHFDQEIIRIREHTNNVENFRKRFFRYFNAFMMIRYMHFMRQEGYPDVPVDKAASELASALGVSNVSLADTEAWLELYRAMDKDV